MTDKTSFQNKCELALNTLLKSHGLTLKGRTEREVQERFTNQSYVLITGSILDCNIWIYDTQADIRVGKRTKVMESDDYDSEDDLVAAFIKEVDKSIRAAAAGCAFTPEGER